MRATCHRANVQRRYDSGVLSLPHIAAWLLWLLAALLPLLLAQGSRGFALRVSSYREQPAVELTYQVLSVLEGEQSAKSGGAAQPLTLVHTTLPSRIQHLIPAANTRASHVKSYRRDTNLDGIAESLHVDISTPLLANETVRQVAVLVLLNYTLHSYAQLNMDALVVCMHSSPFSGEALLVDGDLDLQLRKPLEITDSVQQPYSALPVLNLSRVQSMEDLQLEPIIRRYRNREYTANFHSLYPIWKSDVGQQALSADTRHFRTHLSIRINAVDVIYRPQWAEVAKNAWIQYYCILVVVSTLVASLREYLFTRKVRVMFEA